jgi:hypothetical protein
MSSLTVLTYFWGQQHARADADMEEVEHRLEFTQGNYIAAIERLAKNRLPTEGNHSHQT